MKTLKLTIAYDGTNYAGWQYQPDQTTLQETLERALKKITGEQIRVLASGRTDAGVHALGQVVGFRTECKLPPDELLRAINANLPDDMAVVEAAEAPADFHAISHACRKRYRYVIYDGPVRDIFQRRYAWHFVRGRLDEEAMARAAEALRGTHDFSSFETAGAPRESSVRTIYDISVQRGRAGQGGIGGCGDAGMRGTETPRDCGRVGNIIIEVEADGFLYNMVRAIVGTLVEIGSDHRSESWLGEVLRATDRRAAGPTAPPQGLFLVRVEY